LPAFTGSLLFDPEHGRGMFLGNVRLFLNSQKTVLFIVTVMGTSQDTAGM
jgi:hypothetical protein